MIESLSEEHTILERPFMLVPPFGQDEEGKNIRDMSGVYVHANVEYLEEYVARKEGPERGRAVIRELCRLLNERIPDPTYHIDEKFLRNLWHCYSYEFVSYVREFGERLSGDPHYHCNVGKKKHISPVIQVLARPFSVAQIYRMLPYFVDKYTKDTFVLSVQQVTERAAVVRMKFMGSAVSKIAPYMKACARLSCETAKWAIA